MRIGAVALGLCLGAMSIAPVLAQQPQPTQAQVATIRSSCKADFQAYCASAPHAGMAALSCLQQNVAKLSPPCGKAVAAINAPPAAPAAAPTPGTGQPPPSPKAEARFLREYCAADYRRLCAGVRPRGGAGLACLNEHAQALSPDCQKALASKAPQ